MTRQPVTLSFPAARSGRGRGFTIIELLIAVIIIGILVAIIVPVLANRANEARLAAARTDIDALMSAQQHAAIDTGYYYRLYVLDDVQLGDGTPASDPRDVVDGVRDEALRNDAQFPTSLFIDTKSGEMLDLAAAQVKYRTLTTNETSFNWNGAYVNISKKTKPAPEQHADPFGNPPPAVNPPLPAGLPLDPYANPYLFFTKEGLMREPNGQIEPSVLYNGINYSTVIFDRPTILSMGPDGAPGDGSKTPPDLDAVFGKGDDIFRQF